MVVTPNTGSNPYQPGIVSLQMSVRFWMLDVGTFPGGPTSLVNNCHKSLSALSCSRAHSAIRTALYQRYIREYIEDITCVSMTDDVYDTVVLIIIFPGRDRGKYHNLGPSVVNIVCHGQGCNILFITVELLN